MPEPLKNLYSIDLIDKVASDFKLEYKEFNSELFIKTVLSNQWEVMELKARMRHVAQTLGLFLPADYIKSIELLLPVSNKYTGLEHMFFPDFVELFGLEHFDVSMKALEYLTSGSSSEFAIRPFIKKYPQKTMKQMRQWSRSKNEHVRRLASEGCRPRLPWAMALPEFKSNPTEVFKVILKLIEDESLYVRRSVANNLNDISKDNPHLVIDIAEQYLGKYSGQSAKINWTIKHACRGLLKQGDKKILKLFGYRDTHHVQVKNFVVEKKVALGDKLNFQFELVSSKQSLGKLRVEFIIDFMKANGNTSGKIFKITEGEYPQNNKKIMKYFSFKPISTRKYYSGKHQLSVIINGNKIATQAFELI